MNKITFEFVRNGDIEEVIKILSEKIIYDKYWLDLVRHREIPDELIDKYIDKFPRMYLEKNQKLSLYIISKHYSKFSKMYLFKHQEIPVSFMKEGYEKGIISIKHLIEYFKNNNPKSINDVDFFIHHMTKEEIRLFIHCVVLTDDIVDNIMKNDNKWAIDIVDTQNLSNPIIYKYLKYFTLEKIIENQKINYAFMIKHEKDIMSKYRTLLMDNHNIPFKFIKRHMRKWNWFSLSSRQRLPEDILEKKFNQINQGCLYPQKLSKEFIKKHVNQIDWEEFIKKINYSEDELSLLLINPYAQVILGHQKLSYEFIINNFEFFKYSIESVFSNRKMKKDDIDKIKLLLTFNS